jgi:hypothetical protein
MNDKTSRQAPEQSDHQQSDRSGGIPQVTRTELVWPGKYNEDGSRKEVPRVRLPFQVIETLNKGRSQCKATGRNSTKK